MDPEQRRTGPKWRRDVNDLVRSPDGRLSEAKRFAVVFKLAMLKVFLEHAEAILREWLILTVFVCAFLFPELFKKVVSMYASWKTSKGEAK